MNNITISGKICALFADEFTEKEIGQLAKAVIAYAESGTVTEFDDRAMRIVYQMLLQEMSAIEDFRAAARDRQARYREKKKERR